VIFARSFPFLPLLRHYALRKQTKPNYIALINDLEAMGFSANLDTLEVGSLGHFDKEAIATLHAILPNLTRSRIPVSYPN